MKSESAWLIFALGSAAFGGLTAVLAKVGVEGIDSNLARALQLAPASRVAPIDKLSVVVAIALGVLVLGESLTAKFLLGAALIVAGVFVIAAA